MISKIPLSLYIHIPWCIVKCPYCDFNSHAVKHALPLKGYLDALFSDLENEAIANQGRKLSSIFIGGGTPSLVPGDFIARIMERVVDSFSLDEQCEITIEANPESLSGEKAQIWRRAGINRLSIGMQSLNNRHLEALGRAHNKEHAILAYETAKHNDFDNINIDLMYALPEQSVEQAISDIEEVVALGPQHISHYQLTIEPNTYFAHNQPKNLPDENTIISMEQACKNILDIADYNRYEVSAFATANKQCLHNLNYWQFGDYVGIGAGSHSKITDKNNQVVTRAMKVRSPNRYIASLTEENFVQQRYQCNGKTIVSDFLLNSVRLKAGYSEDLFSIRTGYSIDVMRDAIKHAVADGLITHKNKIIKCTSKGYMLVDYLLSHYFYPHLDKQFS